MSATEQTTATTLQSQSTGNTPTDTAKELKLACDLVQNYMDGNGTGDNEDWLQGCKLLTRLISKGIKEASFHLGRTLLWRSHKTLFDGLSIEATPFEAGRKHLIHAGQAGLVHAYLQLGRFLSELAMSEQVYYGDSRIPSALTQEEHRGQFAEWKREAELYLQMAGDTPQSLFTLACLDDFEMRRPGGNWTSGNNLNWSSVKQRYLWAAKKDSSDAHLKLARYNETFFRSARSTEKQGASIHFQRIKIQECKEYQKEALHHYNSAIAIEEARKESSEQKQAQDKIQEKIDKLTTDMTDFEQFSNGVLKEEEQILAKMIAADASRPANASRASSSSSSASSSSASSASSATSASNATSASATSTTTSATTTANVSSGAASASSAPSASSSSGASNFSSSSNAHRSSSLTAYSGHKRKASDAKEGSESLSEENRAKKRRGS